MSNSGGGNSGAGRPAFKHAAHLGTLPECPPSNYMPRNVTAYRFVFDPDPKNKSYLPQALKPVPRRFDTDKERCEAVGLSLWTTETGARNLFESLKKNHHPNIAHAKVTKILGSHLNRLSITTAHGECDDPRGDGHFTFHEYATCNLATVATRIGPA